MPEFEPLTYLDFARWHPSLRPVAVLRVQCDNGHDIGEVWRMTDGRRKLAPGPGARDTGERSIYQLARGGALFRLGGPLDDEAEPLPDDPDDPDRRWFVTWFVCPRPSCNLRTKMDSAVVLDRMLAAVEHHPSPAPHPSGAPMVCMNINAWRRAEAGRRHTQDGHDTTDSTG